MYVQSTINVPSDVNAQQFFNAIQRAINSVINATETDQPIHVSAYVFNSDGEAVY